MAEKKKKRHGCLITFLVTVAVIVLAIFLVWKFALNRGPGALAKQIINGPVDRASTAVVQKSLDTAGLKGAKTAVVTIPGSQDKAAIIVADPAWGNQPAAGSEGKKAQALAVIKQIVEANKNNNLGLKRVSYEYDENGIPAASVTAPMDALEALNDGKINQADFLGKMDLNLNVNNLKKLESFPSLNDYIGDLIFKGVFK